MPSLTKFSRSEISKLLASAKRAIRHQSLDILLAPTVNGQNGRILAITPRRIGNAPERNKIRRRLKALYYELGLYQKGLDCVVIVKKEGGRASFDQLKLLLLKAYENYQNSI